MVVFCVNLYFEENSMSLCYVHTNIDYQMVIEIEPIYWIFEELFKKQ